MDNTEIDQTILEDARPARTNEQIAEAEVKYGGLIDGIEAELRAERSTAEPIAYLRMWHTEDTNGRDDGFEVCDSTDIGAFPVYAEPVMGR